MEIAIEWHGEQFNVNLASKPGVDPFLSVKGCRIVNGQDGPFVGWPANKNENTGKWWKHVWGSDKFSLAVLEKAMASKPSGGRRQQQQDDSIPF